MTHASCYMCAILDVEVSFEEEENKINAEKCLAKNFPQSFSLNEQSFIIIKKV